jgi:predicted TIM-barrel fold metal-dependent hydrolase
VLKNPSFRGYAALTNLCQIDWSITPTPVVISHAGMMGHPLNEIKDLIPVLLRILSIHNNVFIDVSALDSTVLCLLVEKIDRKRIVFGSDAFYFPQWCAVVKLFHALRQTASDAEEAFIEMAGKNPTRYIFRH